MRPRDSAAPMDDTRRDDPYVIYLCPLVWRPLQANFAPRFQRLSDTCSGAVFTMSGTRHRGTPIGRFRVYTEPESGSPLKYLRRCWVQIGLPVALLWAQRHERKVVVAYDAYLSGLAGVLLKAILGAKLIVEINGDDQNQGAQEHGSVRRFLMGALFRLAVAAADAVKVVNGHQEAFMRKKFPRKRIYRFPDFVASDFFSSLDRTDGKYLLSIGHPFHLKGVDVLIRGFQSIAARYPDLKLRIMGYTSPSELARYRQLAGEDPRVQFVGPGWIEDVGEQVRGCTAYVSASRREAGARVVFEAMACAKPIVSSRTNSGNDYVRDGETGFLFKTGDSQDLAQKLQLLLDDRDTAQRMGQAAFAWLVQEFSESAYLEKFNRMIREVLA
jgi:glycosyltransferase involved in cell wall biosynthesis